MAAHKSYGSPASVGASKGAGTVAGAGQMPPKGPGPAAQKKMGKFGKMETPNYAPASSARPTGMKTYREE